MTAGLGAPVLVRHHFTGETVENRTGEQKAMREAKLVGLSQDGKTIILAVAETGEEFAIPVDDRLRAALRGDRARLGQLEIQMESALRPRDIQARIRAGESPEAVAAVASMPMERVMAFAGPVLAEREHIANLAQRASVRRRGGEGPTRSLDAWVTERLRTRQIDPASAEWDAWRRDDGRWAVKVSYFTDEDEHVAMFAYDAPGRYAVPDDEEARWLVGEQAQVTLPQSNERRLAAVADFDISLAPDHGADSYEAGFEDAISITRDRSPARESDTGRGAGPEVGRDSAREAGRDQGRDAGYGPRRVRSIPSPDDEPTLIDVPIEQQPTVRPAVRAVEQSAQLPVETPPLAPEERAATPENRFTERRTNPPLAPSRPAPEQPGPEAPIEQRQTDDPRPADARGADPRPAQARPDEVSPAASASDNTASTDAEAATPDEPKKKPARRGSKRASVPSWDEIMFGKKAD
ncbi:MAG TPA: septation protein SepH [Kribbella sp.]|jgi:hypothetical protein